MANAGLIRKVLAQSVFKKGLPPAPFPVPPEEGALPPASLEPLELILRFSDQHQLLGVALRVQPKDRDGQALGDPILAPLAMPQ